MSSYPIQTSLRLFIASPLRSASGFVFAAILVFFLAPMAGAQEGSSTRMQVEDAFGEGVRLLLGDKPDKALIQFSKAAELDPNNAAIQYKYSETLMRLGKLPEAEQRATRALDLDASNPYYYQLLANIQQRQGKHRDAQKVWQRLVKKYPNEADYYYPLAESLLQQKKVKDAIAVLNQLEKQVGRNAELTRQKQQILLRDNRLREAIVEGEALVKAFPDEADYMLALAEILANNNQRSEAVTWLMKARALEPENGYVSLLLFDIYNSQRKPEEAAVEMEKALKHPDVNIDDKVMLLRPLLNPAKNTDGFAKGIELARHVSIAHPLEAKAFALLGDFYNLADRKREARDTYVKSAALPGVTLPVMQEIVRLDAELNEIDSLAKHAGMASELFPQQPVIWLFKGRANYIQKKYLDATEALSMAAKLAPGNTALQTEAYAMSGDAFNKLKDHTSSDAAYQKALKLDPDNEHVLNNFSYYLSLRKENLGLARQMCERLMKLKPNEPTYLDTYGWVLFQLKEYKEAAVLLQRAAAAEDANAVVIEHYGDALWKAGQQAKAIEEWQRAKKKGGEVSPALEKKVATRSYVE